MILTPDQRLRVFVSSTLQELAAERAAVRDAIAGLQLTPVLFELGARPHPPQALYRAYVEQSHVFVGIYGESYGWVAPGASISGIEDEYQLSHDLPRPLLGAADALRVRLHSPLWGPAVERHERLVEELRDSLGEAAFHERYDVGQALAPGDANDLAVRIAAVPAAVSG